MSFEIDFILVWWMYLKPFKLDVIKGDRDLFKGSPGIPPWIPKK